MKIKNCQHYSYNNNEYDLEWGDAHYFSENFKIISKFSCIVLAVLKM